MHGSRSVGAAGEPMRLLRVLTPHPPTLLQSDTVGVAHPASSHCAGIGVACGVEEDPDMVEDTRRTCDFVRVGGVHLIELLRVGETVKGNAG
eukprot:m.89873 g.89873  ORF g.89873 m.89873 type:complete len:92 (+) comp9826_c0_seq2:419-694(+)